MIVPLLALLSAAFVPPPAGSARACKPSPIRVASESLHAEVRQRNANLVTARLAGRVDALMTNYAPDSVFMPEHQPRLYGVAQGTAYYRAYLARLPERALTFTTMDIVPLDGGGLEWGTFEVVRGANDDPVSSTLAGKYLHLWRRQADGTLKLTAEVWGYSKPLDDPSSHWFSGLERGKPSARVPSAKVAAELGVLNASNAASVREHDYARIGQYADDAVYLPFAEQPQIGLSAIRSHLMPYIERGRGTTFERLDVGNDGFEIIDGHILEYSKFAVHWRAGERAGVTSGGGLRLWRRGADCSLKILWQIGTHDYRP
ncbi:ketosteroid isomerase-like protein [Sphingomonas trueperi]|uniref:YybH family protein n=1 Tax=Sphingomonas trueperi TaxID=53317 RepID=UPI003396DDC1